MSCASLSHGPKAQPVSTSAPRHEQRSDGNRCVVVHGWQNVRVGLKRDRNVRAAEPFLSDTGADAALQCDRNPRVPQPVQRNRRQLVSDQRPTKGLIHPLWMQRLTSRAAKDKPGCGRRRLSRRVLEVSAQYLDGQRIESDGASPCLGLGLADIDLPADCDHRLGDERPPVVQVDVRPAQTERFASTLWWRAASTTPTVRRQRSVPETCEASRCSTL